MGMTYACMFVGEHKRPLLQGWNVGLVKVVCCPSHRPCRLRFQMLGVQWVSVRCRDHTLSFQGCGGGVPFQFWILHGEGGGVYGLLCLLGKCVSVRTKMQMAY